MKTTNQSYFQCNWDFAIKTYLLLRPLFTDQRLNFLGYSWSFTIPQKVRIYIQFEQYKRTIALVSHEIMIVFTDMKQILPCVIQRRMIWFFFGPYWKRGHLISLADPLRPLHHHCEYDPVYAVREPVVRPNSSPWIESCQKRFYTGVYSGTRFRHHLCKHRQPCKYCIILHVNLSNKATHHKT